MPKTGTRGDLPAWESTGLSNLFLIHEDIRTIPDSQPLPESYTLRVTDFSGDDLADLAVTLDMAFGIQHGAWDLERAQKELKDNEQVQKTHVVCYAGKVIGCASNKIDPKFPGKGYLHWVAVHPDHQGLGLAAILTTAVMREFVATHALTACVLETQDPGLPAIKTYLKLGFRPVMADESHPERWRKVLPQLGYVFEDYIQL